MRPDTSPSPLTPVLWLAHLAIIGAMAWAGVHLGQWLSTIYQQPIQAADITAEWWQIFRRFAATISFGLFLAILLGYVILIRPGKT